MAASSAVADPQRALNSALTSEFGAVTATTRDRAEVARRRPAEILVCGEATTHKYVSQAPDFLTSAARARRRAAFTMAGPIAKVIPIAMLYDSFTIYVLMLLNDLGVRAQGQSGPLVASGPLPPEGSPPCNTHIGMLSGAHGGSLHLTEAVRQLGGEAGAGRKVAGAKVGLVQTAGGSLSSHSTVLLGV
jgi:hypothetical protein